MARKLLDIVIKVQSQKADQKLKSTSQKIKQTGTAVKGLSANFKDFNRTLFTTTAFIGIFRKAFSSIGETMQLGADIGRLTTTFERSFGSRGKFFETMRDMTDTSVDMMTVMKEGVSLKALGIVKDSAQLAGLMAKAGTAAKLAGMDAGQGVSKFSSFMKTGNVSQLRFLNLISESNTGLIAQLSILKKSGGVMGRVLSMQHRRTLGLKLLEAATKGHLKGNRDHKDTLHDLGQSFKFMRGEIGELISKAFQPMLEKVIESVTGFTHLIRGVREGDKGFMFFVKTLGVVTTGAAALAATLGTLRLSVMMLNSLGLGLPGLFINLMLVSGGFLAVTDGVDGITKKISFFGDFLKGIFQLVSSLDTETGIAKMDKRIHDILKERGLLGLAQNIARIFSVIGVAIKDTADGIAWLADVVDSAISSIGNAFIKIFGGLKRPWQSSLVTNSLSDLDKIKRAVLVLGATIGTLLIGRGIFRTISGGLSKIPGLGKMFGGRGLGLRGSTPATPMFVSDVANSAKSILGGNDPKSIFGWIKSKVGIVFGALRIAFVAAIPAMILALQVALVAAAGIIGYKVGQYLDKKLGINKAIDKHTTATTKEGFEGNILERNMWSFGKTFATDDYKNEQKAQGALETPYKGNFTKIPEYRDSTAGQDSYLEGAMSALEADAAKTFKSRMEVAKSEDSAGGTDITKDEWVEIFRTALDGSSNLTEIKEKTANADDTQSTEGYNRLSRGSRGMNY